MLAPYLKDLLYRYDTVVIPGFGGIKTSRASARIDEEKQVFHPPSKKLEFDASLTHDDKVLVGYIARADGLSYEAALNFVKYQVEDWKAKLQQEALRLEGIGKFYLNDEEKVQFKPDKKSNFLADAFGLDTVAANNLEAEKRKGTSQTVPVKTSAVGIEAATHRQGYRYWVYAASFLLLITLSWFLYESYLRYNWDFSQWLLSPRERQQQLDQKLETTIFEIEQPLPALTVKLKPAEDTAIPRENQNGAVSSIQNQLGTTQASGKQYYIVAGAFRATTNAQKKVNQLKTGGYPDAVIMGRYKSGLTYVAYAHYSNRKEAINTLLEIQKLSPDAWIMVVKK